MSMESKYALSFPEELSGGFSRPFALMKLVNHLCWRPGLTLRLAKQRWPRCSLTSIGGFALTSVKQETKNTFLANGFQHKTDSFIN